MRGFTLIEVMIVVAIIAIVAAIALPSYQSQTRDARRAECASVLMTARQQMERHYSKNYTYVGAAAGTTFQSSTDYYNITMPEPTATTFTITCAPQGDQANDGCGNLTLNQAGIKTAQNGTVANCWG